MKTEDKCWRAWLNAMLRQLHEKIESEEREAAREDQLMARVEGLRARLAYLEKCRREHLETKEELCPFNHSIPGKQWKPQ